MSRPNLTHLTQAEFKKDPESNFIFVNGSAAIVSADPYKNVIASIPNLVQLVEMLFDHTKENPHSIVHVMCKDVLNDLATK